MKGFRRKIKAEAYHLSDVHFFPPSCDSLEELSEPRVEEGDAKTRQT